MRVLRVFLLLSAILASGNIFAQDKNGCPASGTKTILGAAENVTLPEWNISLDARIDSGADISVLDAQNIRIEDGTAYFETAGRGLNLPIIGWIYVRNSSRIEKRPLVEISVTLGGKIFKTKVNLRDRGEMKYKFLVGRNILDGNFLIDTGKSLIP